MYEHLDSIDLRLSHERARVAQSKNQQEREWREHNVRMIERERASEIEFLEKKGVTFPTLDEILSDELIDAMSDEELLEALK